ncbi:hypothetical protein A2875_05230 [Candidatus Gottesmanbacteria bacterium RIFCSPHIGHO2_01_FULL_46_14]|uniref:Solute-binding protein family 5 domain-containing protein n=1 Tax=Candidatus Gottesmanbacteria bacterium RIFCSPHIGHO2_01_FULL_46_14 TaxID=1798380 RepID=A0A1F5ZP62_9BACT|nr:MAG: hypothetical protein A2875_05230 [Candidatus Gottesmanbacteria bacterium RIFCSPHIGHO2_01_FULL_46_14]
MRKYRFSLIIGLIIGIVGSLGFFRLYPFASRFLLRPTQNIAMVGEFTPSNLPLTIQQRISRGLTQIAPDGSVIPSLATNWEVKDEGRQYVFTLDTSAVWHTGKTLTANDINYNIRNVIFTPLDAATLKVTLQEPFSPFLTLLAKPIFQRGLRGVGEYRVSGIRLNGERVVYLKLTPAKDMSLPNLEYRFYRTEAAAVLAYKLGNVDSIEDATEPTQLKDWRNTTITTHTKNDRIVAVYFNLKNSFVAEKAVRQALAYAVPDLGTPRVNSPIGSTSWAFSDKGRNYTFDMARARRLLGQESSPSGQIVITTFSQYLDTAQKIAGSWNQLGIPTTIRVENTVPEGYQVLISAQDIPPDPDQYPFWHQTQAQTNITGYANVKIDKLLEDGRREIDPEKRKIIYADFVRYLTEDVPAIFLYHPAFYTIRRSTP